MRNGSRLTVGNIKPNMLLLLLLLWWRILFRSFISSVVAFCHTKCRCKWSRQNKKWMKEYERKNCTANTATTTKKVEKKIFDSLVWCVHSFAYLFVSRNRLQCGSLYSYMYTLCETCAHLDILHRCLRRDFCFALFFSWFVFVFTLRWQN